MVVWVVVCAPLAWHVRYGVFGGVAVVTRVVHKCIRGMHMVMEYVCYAYGAGAYVGHGHGGAG